MPRVVFVSSRGGPDLGVEVPAGGSLVDVCDAAGAPIPFSCRSASCGTCRVVVLEGAELLLDAEDEEMDVLDAFGGRPPRQRLACQAKLASRAGTVRVRPARDDE